MALELNLLITAVGAISSLVKDTVVTVQAIRSGLMTKNDETKQQLAESLKQLQQNLQHAGELSHAAEGYFQTYENILELLSLSRRLERFLKDNLDDLRDRRNSNYAGGWKVLEAMFETIDSRREAPQKVVLDRAQWYDKDDKAQIELLLQQFTSAYERASTHLRHRIADDLQFELQATTRYLQDVHTLLRSTLYDKILKTLQKLGS
jgi:hypothetical protein